jgi:hypothetical protein
LPYIIFHFSFAIGHEAQRREDAKAQRRKDAKTEEAKQLSQHHSSSLFFIRHDFLCALALVI